MFATGARNNVSYLIETAYGVIPAGTPKTARVQNSSKFNFKRSPLADNELRSDRQVADVRLGLKNVDLSLPFQLSYGDFDDFWAGFMFSTWAANVLKIGQVPSSMTLENAQPDVGVYEQVTGAMVNTFDLAIQPNAIVSGNFGLLAKDYQLAESLNTTCAVDSAAKTFTRSDGGSFLDDLWVVGDKYTTSGFADAGNNGTFTISAVTATVITASTAVGLVTKVATAGCNFQNATLGAPSAASTNPAYDSFTGQLTEGGVLIANVASLSLKGTNNLSGAESCFFDTIQGIVPGRCIITGTLVLNFSDQSVRKKFFNGKSSSLSFTLGSGAAGSKSMTFSLPNIKYTGNDRTIGEKLMPESCTFQAVYDTTSASTMSITRIP